MDNRMTDERAAPELLPCPFCAGEAPIYDVCSSLTPFGVRCTACNALGADDATAAQAAIAWNRRAPVAAPATDGLPALPKRTNIRPSAWGIAVAYTSDQMRQYALDAIAADRRTRKAVLDEQAATLLAKQKKIQAMRSVGTKMANTLFNLSQRPGEAIEAKLAASMKELQEEWDAAVRTPASIARAELTAFGDTWKEEA